MTAASAVVLIAPLREREDLKTALYERLIPACEERAIYLSSDIKWMNSENYLARKASKELFNVEKIKEISGVLDRMLKIDRWSATDLIELRHSVENAEGKPYLLTHVIAAMLLKGFEGHFRTDPHLGCVFQKVRIKQCE